MESDGDEAECIFFTAGTLVIDDFESLEESCLPRCSDQRCWRRYLHEGADFFYSFSTTFVGEVACGSYFGEILGQNMQLKSSEEFLLGQGHGFRLILVSIVFVLNGDCVVGLAQYSMIGDSYLVGISCEIFYDL